MHTASLALHSLFSSSSSSSTPHHATATPFTAIRTDDDEFVVDSPTTSFSQHHQQPGGGGVIATSGGDNPTRGFFKPVSEPASPHSILFFNGGGSVNVSAVAAVPTRSSIFRRPSALHIDKNGAFADESTPRSAGVGSGYTSGGGGGPASGGNSSIPSVKPTFSRQSSRAPSRSGTSMKNRPLSAAHQDSRNSPAATPSSNNAGGAKFGRRPSNMTSDSRRSTASSMSGMTASVLAAGGGVMDDPLQQAQASNQLSSSQQQQQSQQPQQQQQQQQQLSAAAQLAADRAAAVAHERGVRILRRDPSFRTPDEVEFLVTWIKRMRIATFESLTDVSFRLLCHHLRYELLPPYAVIFREGTGGDTFYVVLKGTVSVWASILDGSLTTAPPSFVPADSVLHATVEFGTNLRFLNFIHGGDVKSSFGELALLSSDSLRTASVMTEHDGVTASGGEVELLTVTKPVFDKALKGQEKQKLEEQLTILRSFNLFSHVGDRHLIKLSYYFQSKFVPAQATLVTQGTRASHLYFIVSGQVEITTNQRKGTKGAAGNKRAIAGDTHVALIANGVIIRFFFVLCFFGIDCRVGCCFFFFFFFVGDVW
jgi:CRP-like cAMP-binding protein